MFNFFYRLFNHDKIDSMQHTLDVYKERNEQLEDELREYKGYKLKYEVTKLYVEDDDALLELFESAKKSEQYNKRETSRLGQLAGRQSAMTGLFSGCNIAAATGATNPFVK